MPMGAEEEEENHQTNGQYDDSTLRDLEIGGTTSNSASNIAMNGTTGSSIEASSIIKLNNGDVLYMREINR